MEFPSELRNRINELAEREDTKALRASAARLSESYRAESPNGKHGAVSRIDTIAYAAVRMSATFAAVSKALELSLARFGGEIGSVLDVGAGTGAGAVAAARLTECSAITCIEREQNMLELGRELCDCAGVSANWEKRDISLGIAGSADLVICSYCLNELPEDRRETIVSQLANAAKKLLVIVEPGTPFSFACMKQTRRILLNGALRIAAPCPHEKACPLSDDDWCHFTARAQRSKLHKLLKNADAPYEDEKFCFLAAAKEDCTRCAARVLRRPLIQSGRITLKLCAADGLKTETVTKKRPLFAAARKSEHGGEFPLERSIL
ncbi:MAG: small ribosomal subunit Rsm22 family protein [Oscillospiraceae bacterium]|nr:small ribosomal subunit Rsm22 family protein [Oscillospiraceae bacterium]